MVVKSSVVNTINDHTIFPVVNFSTTTQYVVVDTTLITTTFIVITTTFSIVNIFYTIWHEVLTTIF